ncbi:hypothetical protein EV363DRAFT_1298505 [Boletus edulis]|nr:hypothetical protein EV363DRAFT_1298505 [Boletus edulis]
MLTSTGSEVFRGNFVTKEIPAQILGSFWCTRDNQWPPVLSNRQKERIDSATTLVGGLAAAGAISGWTGRRLVLGIADVIFIGGASSLPYRMEHDWRPLLDWNWRRLRVLHRPTLYPRTLPNATLRKNGRPQRGHDHPGQATAYGTDAGFADMNGVWRWIVGLSPVPAGLQLALLVFLPAFTSVTNDRELVKTAQILVRRGSMEAVYRILARVYATAIRNETSARRPHRMRPTDKASRSPARPHFCNESLQCPEFPIVDDDVHRVMSKFSKSSFQQPCGFTALSNAQLIQLPFWFDLLGYGLSLTGA